jgi:hypothetical protein
MEKERDSLMSKKTTPELLIEIETVFEEIARSLATAADQCSYRPAARVAEQFGLIKQGAADPYADQVWERSEGTLSLWFRWHWYDQSRAFSVRPDMNKLRLEMRQGSVVLRLAESSYED